MHIYPAAAERILLPLAWNTKQVEVLQERIEMVPSYIFYGYRELQVRFTPRAA